MNAKNLSDRLAQVASYVEQDSVLADIGSDHAYLPCWLVQNGRIQKAVAGEVVKGPFESARRTVEKEGLADRITVRFADGLLAVEPEDGVSVISIAGMGGTLIASILAAAPDRLEGVTRLILQPNLHAKAIRLWGAGNGWLVKEEAILKEDRKLYEVLVLERGEARYSEEELLMGPILMKEKTDAFREKWEGELRELTRVCTALDASTPTEETLEKRRQLEETKQLIERVLQQ
ncbi:SAM-dependent methyltransferase [Sporosarcina sp. NCCP-2716]|uniref:tRNA (adenine(22)-N(1))-methyltransferase n=1 Tax=Sporosarcina sp. NCCP-2716 TaxID=2943679 RepID=UPI0020419CC8|nr:tRNA (adenine(22)-N(1))-methyltransferase TrmK [Sporosarcina sp. NCCP-2716]GKV68061.1 SAM-dependent methyltransferase [Sporosarcina sp. NCCP-2716]